MSRIAILGAGAIGSAVGAMLGRAGEDVTLIGRAAHMNAIRRSGLKVDGRLGSFTADVRTAERLQFTPDYALLTVKTQDVVPALEANLDSLKDVPLLTMQNGVRSDELAAMLLPASQIASAVVNISATYLAPGMVVVVYPGTLVIGHPFHETAVSLDTLRALLQNAAPTTVSVDIRAVHWLKLLFNVNNAFPALLDRSLHQLYADPYMRVLAARVIREGLRSVDAAGIRLESLPEVSVGLFRLLGVLPPALAGLLIAYRARRIEGKWPLLGSTLQSLRRGKPTEIEYLNGEIVRLGARTGKSTRLNAKLVELVHEAEKTSTFLTVDELRRRMDGT